MKTTDHLELMDLASRGWQVVPQAGFPESTGDGMVRIRVPVHDAE